MKKYAIIKQNVSTGQYQYQLWETRFEMPDREVCDWQYGPFDFGECTAQVHDRFGSDYEIKPIHDAFDMMCHCGHRRGDHSYISLNCPDGTGYDKKNRFQSLL